VVDVADADVLAILTRAPASGGKSRLFAELAAPFDPALPAALLLDTLDCARRPGITVVVAVEPADACADVRALVGTSDHVVPQSQGDLGFRMRALFAWCLGRGARTVVVIGSDLPDLPARLVDEAFTLLRADPRHLVIGPATDGGYYLIGSGQMPDVFDGIAWGSRSVLASTLCRSTERGVPVHQLDPWHDVDTLEDLHQVLRSAGSGSARRTRYWAAAHGLDPGPASDRRGG
jgi:uncharacterized protein